MPPQFNDRFLHVQVGTGRSSLARLKFSWFWRRGSPRPGLGLNLSPLEVRCPSLGRVRPPPPLPGRPRQAAPRWWRLIQPAAAFSPTDRQAGISRSCIPSWTTPCSTASYPPDPAPSHDARPNPLIQNHCNTHSLVTSYDTF